VSDIAIAITILVSATTGGLVVYIFFAARPTAYDEPIDRYAGGVRVQQVAGFYGARWRVVVALALLVACLAFLAGALAH
jgi:hypothetical protein